MQTSLSPFSFVWPHYSTEHHSFTENRGSSKIRTAKPGSQLPARATLPSCNPYPPMCAGASLKPRLQSPLDQGTKCRQICSSSPSPDVNNISTGNMCIAKSVLVLEQRLVNNSYFTSAYIKRIPHRSQTQALKTAATSMNGPTFAVARATHWTQRRNG